MRVIALYCLLFLFVLSAWRFLEDRTLYAGLEAIYTQCISLPNILRISWQRAPTVASHLIFWNCLIEEGIYEMYICLDKQF